MQRDARRRASSGRPDVFAQDYDIYDPKERRVYSASKKKERRRHNGLWAFVMLMCFVCLLTLGLLVAPQLLGVRFTSLPNYAFVNGSVITLNSADYDNYLLGRQYMASDVIFPGITIDGVDVGGMTRQQAQQALGGVAAAGGGSFSVSVTVDGNTWVIDSEQVPMTRNVEAMLDLAMSYGRRNSGNARSQRITPYQERMAEVAALKNEPVHLSTILTYDRGAIRALTDAIARSVNVEPIDASVAAFDFNTRSFSFNADVSGRYISPDTIYEQVMQRLEMGDYYSHVRLETQTVLADVTKAELMSSFCRISSYTTRTTSNKNRNTNIQLSAAAINGMVVESGQVFSFNAATGQRTEAKGYKPAAAIAGGQLNDEVGGGVCQTSSTLFNAVARANLEIVARSPHAWPSSYVAEGMDATVDWPSLDFKFRNTSRYPIFIVAYYNDRKVTVELYGMGLGDGVTIDLEHVKVRDLPAPVDPKIVQNPSLPAGTQRTTVNRRDGSVWETYQVWYQNGQEVNRVLLCKSTYKAYQEVLEWN